MSKIYDNRTVGYIKELEASSSSFDHVEAAFVLGTMPRTTLDVEGELMRLRANKILERIVPADQASSLPLAGLTLMSWIDGTKPINFLANRLVRDYIG